MNKTAVITGASGGIGAEISRLFAENGFDVVLHFGKNEEKAKRTAEQLRLSYGVNAEVIGADFSSAGQTERFCERVLSCCSPEVLVNNAGIAHTEIFQNVPREKAEVIFSINAAAPMLIAQRLLPGMINRKSGRIINISSMWGVVGGSCEVHYSAAKAALIGFTKALAKETGPSGITVNCIAPGLIDTEMNSGLSEEAKRKIADETPVGRIGTAFDIARAALFFAKEESSFITGQVLTVDGGLTV